MSFLHCGVAIYVQCPIYSIVWVGQYLCYMSLLHCDVGWLVFVFYSPSTLCCGLFSICVLCPFYTVMWVGWCLCSIQLLHCVVSWLVFVLCVPSTL